MKKWNFGKVKTSFSTRAVKAGGYSAAAVAVVLALVVLLNLLVGKIPESITKLDTTDTGMFTLSDQTKEIVGGLSEEVTVYWVASSGKEDSDVERLLGRYADLSGNLTVVRKDPVVSPGFTAEYTSDELPENSLIVVCGSRSKVLSYDDILSVDYASYYTTGSYSATFNGESLLTSAVSYVTSSDLPKVYTLTGHGEDELTSSVSSAVTGENMDVESLDLLSAGTVPEDCSCILVYSPASDISADEAATLQSYVEGGGSLYVLTDYVEGGLPNLQSVMAAWGVTLNDGIVLEGDQDHCANGYPHYLLPDLESHDITTPLKDGNYHVLMPVAQGLTIADTLPDSVTVTSLLQTSDQAYSKLAAYNLTTYDKEDGDLDGPFSLGVAITAGADTPGKAVWLTTSLLTDDSADQMVSGANLDLFLNGLGWMCDQESTISIHAKVIENNYLTVSDGAASRLSLLLIGIIPLLFVGCGIFVVVRRRRR